jgi:hypothetical protein
MNDEEKMQRLLLHRIPAPKRNVIPTHRGLLARLWDKVRGWFKC